MTPYADTNGTSGIESYQLTGKLVDPDTLEVRHTAIIVQFKRGTHRRYLYTEASVGPENLREMIALAERGGDLNSFINFVVKNRYAEKL